MYNQNLDTLMFLSENFGFYVSDHEKKKLFYICSFNLLDA